MNFTKVIIGLIKRMKLIGSLLPDRSENVIFSVVKRDSPVVIKTLCIVCFEEVARGLDNVSNNQSKCADAMFRLPLIRLRELSFLLTL